ncbi:hypothetical protein [Kitasatospora sp. NRRL B-11411]|uniref:hypothetical protein n=1 Tax=Kitasatospora sp. NRRL B-11411 TaxID=1463822 RepID=UPI0012FEC6AD|nr:hypothetical protein [Kitasatospora sp. NRRL B-11411]
MSDRLLGFLLKQEPAAAGCAPDMGTSCGCLAGDYGPAYYCQVWTLNANCSITWGSLKLVGPC